MAKLTDPAYLRHSQYRDTSNLLARSNLHERFGRGDWFEWISSHAPWPDRGRILEVGCGNGRFWIDAAELVAEEASVVVTDLSYSMVRETCAADGPERAGSVVALPQLPFAAGAFDLVIVVMVMQHLDDPGPAIAELARVTSANGSLVIGAAGDRHLDELVAIRRTFSDDVTTIGGDFGAGGLEFAAERVQRSFGVVGWHRYEDQLVVDDRNALVEYLRSWPPLDDIDDRTLRHLDAEINRRFDPVTHSMTITKDVGCIIGSEPLRDGVTPLLGVRPQEI